MAKSSFEKIRDGAMRAVEHARGERALTAREVEIAESPKPMRPRHILKLRVNTVGVSQSVFARLLNSSTQTVQAWEQGRTHPSGPALRFLRLIENDPQIIAGLLKVSRLSHRPSRRSSTTNRTAARTSGSAGTS